ncbi:MAG: type IV conjugative transfer system protein TraE, partial [Betaproteobacteria bacterium]|nr:type IV conjugative transfer system protein TraE [Betaproteobacteria bacterium]
MEPLQYRRTMVSLRTQARFFRMLSVLLAIGGACMAGAMLALAARSERVVVVPPEVNESFWVEEDSVSRGYFLEWGYYIVSLLLNVSPGAVDYHNEVLLRYAAPEYRERMRTSLAAAAAKLRREDLTTAFAVSAVEVDVGQGRVAFAGSLASYVKGRRISERAAAFAARFRVERGRLALV